MEDNVRTAANLGAANGDTKYIAENPFVLVPDGYRVHDLEKMLGNPTRKRGNTVVRDAKAFIAIVAKQKTDATQLYGQFNPSPAFKAVFNDDGAAPGWRDHMATYSCPLSHEWTIWTTASGKRMKHEDFAVFIEDNAPDCVDPDSATMIEVSRSIEATKSVKFASAKHLSTGQSLLAYEETINGTANKGQLQIPEVFVIGIPVLEGGDRYKVRARLRYRIDNGALLLWFDLDRPHIELEAAINDVWKLIEAQTGLSIFNAVPAV